MPELRFRPAGPDDLATLRRWDEQQHIIESDPNDDWNWETELHRSPPWREQWIATLDARPIGFMEIIDPQLEEVQYWGEIGPGHRAIDIWIGEASELNKGYGTRMMTFAIERCFSASGVHTILLDPLASNASAHRFYERLGFEFVEARRFGLDDCFVYALRRENHLSVTRK